MSRQVALLFYISQALVIGLHPTAAIGAEGDTSSFRLGGSATVTSDYIFRGVSQTLGRPALQASVDFDHDSGFYAYVWGTNVDFYPDVETDDGARTEIDFAAGYVAEIGDRWSIDTMFVRYVFPGTRSDFNYDYNEVLSTLRFDDRFGVTVAYAGDVDGTATASWFYKADAGFELPATVALDVSYGYFDLAPAYGTGYTFVSAALTREFGEAAATLAFYSAFNGSEQIFFEQAEGSRLVFSIDLIF
ncbi:MAG: TorF family putative porin [Woeseiaceae bacterium]